MEEFDTSATERFERAALVEKAASRAIELVKHYSEIDPYDQDPENPWRNPQDIFDELRLARTQVLSAAAADQGEKIHASKGSNDNFRAIYIGMITDAFAEELEALRNSGEDVDVDILVDCLQSGMDLLTREERIMLSQERARLNKQNQPTILTPHELRQRQLGFHF